MLRHDSAGVACLGSTRLHENHTESVLYPIAVPRVRLGSEKLYIIT